MEMEQAAQTIKTIGLYAQVLAVARMKKARSFNAARAHTPSRVLQRSSWSRQLEPSAGTRWAASGRHPASRRRSGEHAN